MGIGRTTLVWIAAMLVSVGFAQPADQETLSVTVDGTRMQYVLVTPTGFTPGGTYPVLLVLPPAGGSIGDANDALDGYFRAEAQERGWVVVAAVAPYDSTTRLSTLFHLGAEDLIPPLLDLISEEIAFEGDKVHVAGVSNGGVGAFRVATLYPELVHSVLVIPGSAREEDLARIDNLEGIPVRMYVSENEDAPDLERSRATAAALEAAGVAGELIVVPDAGHRITSVGGEEIFDWLGMQRP